jgi:predicted O-methyltransferase YrrM
VITVTDLGSGASMESQRTISSIAETSLSPSKFSALYKRIISKYNHTSIIELGTSLGINTLYLAASKNSKVTTFEGCPEIAGIAAFTFEFAGASNISLIQGNINQTLPAFLQTIRKFDFAFIDANHTYEATMKYFNLLISRLHEKSVIVIDDIHHSVEMEKAWETIIASKLVYGSIDLYRAGVVFFDPSLNKQHVILQF